LVNESSVFNHFQVVVYFPQFLSVPYEHPGMSLILEDLVYRGLAPLVLFPSNQSIMIQSSSWRNGSVLSLSHRLAQKGGRVTPSAGSNSPASPLGAQECTNNLYFLVG